MTRITKDELMQMAREMCVSSSPGRKNFYDDDLVKFTNAILERAAVKCDELARRMSPTDESAGASMCAEKVRALKINTGD